MQISYKYKIQIIKSFFFSLLYCILLKLFFCFLFFVFVAVKEMSISTSSILSSDKEVDVQPCRKSFKSLVAVIHDEGEYKECTGKQNANLGPLVRCCVAFGVYKLLTIPYFYFNVEGSFGSKVYLRKNNFNDWNRLKKYAQKHNYKIVGVCQRAIQNVFNNKNEEEEDHRQDNGVSNLSSSSIEDRIMESKEKGTSIPVHERPFLGSTIFIYNYHPFMATLDPENRDLKLLCDCDYYVHVDGTSKLGDRIHDKKDGLPIARPIRSGQVFLSPDILISIVLQHFTSWAHYKQSSIKGFKYEKKKLPENSFQTYDKTMTNLLMNSSIDNTNDREINSKINDSDSTDDEEDLDHNEFVCRLQRRKERDMNSENSKNDSDAFSLLGLMENSVASGDY